MVNPGWFSFYDNLMNYFFQSGLENGTGVSVTNAVICIVVALSLWVAAFVLQGVGLSVMAKKANAKHARLAFVPFAYLLLVEELAGQMTFFGHKVRRLGLWVMIAEIVATIYHIMYAVAIYVLFVENGSLCELTQTNVGSYVIWTGLSDSAVFWYQFYNAFIILSILTLVYTILLLMLYMGFYKRYAYRNATWLGLGGVIIAFFNGVATFVLRERNRVDYEVIIRARQEAYRRQQQGGAYGNPYGNPYGGPYRSPYGSTPPASPSSPSGQEPFGEFNDDPFGEFSSSSSENLLSDGTSMGESDGAEGQASNPSSTENDSNGGFFD